MSDSPNYQICFSEIAKHMRINADILMEEITEHADKEIERMKLEFNHMEMFAKEVHVGLMVDAMKEIEKAADKEIEKLRLASQYIENNLETYAINNEDWKENPKFHCLLGSTFTESDIVDLIKLCLTRLQR